MIEDVTLEQVKRTSTTPFIHPHLALMPDVHLGLGATVGSVIPTLGAVMPAAVGVDIGCGMIAVRTQFDRTDLERRGDLGDLRRSIERAIPLSAGASNGSIVATAEPRIAELEALAAEAGFDTTTYVQSWTRQLGTLGSGNHFIEVSVDEMDAVWLFLHSGSRGVGNRIAQAHIRVAQAEMRRWWIELPDRDLAYLVEGTEQFDRYIAELGWAQRFALLNREEMMDRVVRQVSEHLGADVEERERINCHPPRPGRTLLRRVPPGRGPTSPSSSGTSARTCDCPARAIRAREGDPGLIPGSMGTASYVVEGRGNRMALDSSPHGAGRAYSRSQARKTFTVEQLCEAMAGIEFRDTDAFLDEIPQAYKSIDQVMADAADLVSVRHVLRQLVNVKGD